jgi:hypothetical protein
MIPPELWWLNPPEPELEENRPKTSEELFGWRMKTWDLLSPEMRQRVIEYYSTHPEEYNPYYAYTGVGTPNPYLGIEFGSRGIVVCKSTPEPEPTSPVTSSTDEYIIQPSTNNLNRQYLSQYWWVVLILVATVSYFVFFRKKRRRR